MRTFKIYIDYIGHGAGGSFLRLVGTTGFELSTIKYASTSLYCDENVNAMMLQLLNDCEWALWRADTHVVMLLQSLNSFYTIVAVLRDGVILSLMRSYSRLVQ